MFVVEQRPLKHENWCDEFIKAQRCLYQTTLEPLLSNTFHNDVTSEYH